MKVWVEILKGRVRHKFEAPDDFVPEFGPPITVVDVTSRVPQPQEHWLYDEGMDTFTSASAPAPPVGQTPLDPTATGVFRPRDPGAAVNRQLFNTGSTDIINVTEAGKLLGILMSVTATHSGTPTMRLEIVLDGGAQEDILVFSAAQNWVLFFTRLASAAGAGTLITGNTLGDSVYLPLDCTYDTSLVVRANTTVKGSGGGVDVWVVRATKQ